MHIDSDVYNVLLLVPFQHFIQGFYRIADFLPHQQWLRSLCRALANARVIPAGRVALVSCLVCNVIQCVLRKFSVNVRLCYFSLTGDFRYCPECRNDASEVVLAGERLKDSKKKQKMASANSSSRRDWGKVSSKAVFF